MANDKELIKKTNEWISKFSEAGFEVYNFHVLRSPSKIMSFSLNYSVLFNEEIRYREELSIKVTMSYETNEATIVSHYEFETNDFGLEAKVGRTKVDNLDPDSVIDEVKRHVKYFEENYMFKNVDQMAYTYSFMVRLLNIRSNNLKMKEEIE